MSRCYPFPPPGYLRTGASGDVTMESVKIQKERVKSHEERKKENKREKRESKHQKKRDEQKSRVSAEKSKGVSAVDSQQKHKSLSDLFGYPPTKVLEDDTEQREHSDVTEEHEPPVASQSFCYSYDSSQANHKRKRQSTNRNEYGNTEEHEQSVSSEYLGNAGQKSNNGARCYSRGGNVIRIRLSGPKSQPTSKSHQEKQLDSCHRISSAQQSHDNAQHLYVGEMSFSECKISELSLVIAKPETKPETEIPSTSGRGEIRSETKSESRSLRKKQKLGAAYKALVEDWVPPPLQIEDDFDDQEWLFGTVPKERSEVSFKSEHKSNSESCNACQTLWPHAHHAPEIDLYVMPYTVPF